MRRTHLILTGLSATIILLSLNRLTTFTAVYLQPYEFLRWLDIHAMLTIPIISVILYYLLRSQIIYGSTFHRSAWYELLGIMFTIGVYLFGAGSGTHEVTNYLNTRFCLNAETSADLCNIIAYNDDSFSHYIYYAGFILLNLALIFLERLFPRQHEMAIADLIKVAANGLFIALGIFANLAFEETVVDIIFFSIVMVIAIYFGFYSRYSYRQLPVTLYFAISYTLGIAATVLYQTIT